MARYYVMLKSGLLEYREKQPKNRPYVSETIARHEDCHTVHHLNAVRSDMSHAASHVMHCYCGYDRGPRHTALVQSMFASMEGK